MAHHYAWVAIMNKIKFQNEFMRAKKTSKYMIGDWVNSSVHHKPVQIDAVTNKKIGFLPYPNAHSLSYISAEWFEPIELTGVMLKANGFKDVTEEEHFIIGNVYKQILDITTYDENNQPLQQKLYISIKKYTDYAEVNIDGCIVITKICYYVHELQQALRLAEAYKFANNFKLFKKDN